MLSTEHFRSNPRIVPYNISSVCRPFNLIMLQTQRVYPILINIIYYCSIINWLHGDWKWQTTRAQLSYTSDNVQLKSSQKVLQLHCQEVEDVVWMCEYVCVCVCRRPHLNYDAKSSKDFRKSVDRCNEVRTNKHNVPGNLKRFG